MPLVINSFVDGHTDTHIPTRKPKQFQETGRMWPKAVHYWFKNTLQQYLTLTISKLFKILFKNTKEIKSNFKLRTFKI